jgi:glycosyl transferase family 1
MTTRRAGEERLRVLILSTYEGMDANAVRDYLLSFRLHSRHDYYYVLDCRRLDGRIDLRPFDVIMIFWDVFLLGPELSDAVREQIARARAVKVVFLQDEYRDVRGVNQAMAELGVRLAFTCVAEADHRVFYPSEAIPTVEALYTVLPGYVPRYLEEIRLDADVSRPIDIGYRSRAMPFYLGDLGQDKTVIAERFQAVARAEELAGDISVLERDRLYGRQWVKFLRECRCVLGTSSGASVVDFTGEIRRACERHLALKPEASYSEVKARFFADADWKVTIDTVSPRVFEAAALGCTLVQHEGLYGGILRPDEHYICVRRDYSNAADVIDRVRDRGFCREMAKRAHRDLIVGGRYSFQAFARWFDGVLDSHVPRGSRVGSLSPLRFYGEGYVRRRQAIVPWGTGFVVTSSAQLAHHLARLALERLPRARRGPLMSRLIHNPAGIVRKGLAAWRLLRRDRGLRAILAMYRRQPGLRSAVRLHALLDDLLRLDLIRAARRGTLRSRQPFTVDWEYDAAAGALVAVSARGPVGGGGPAAGAEPAAVGPALTPEAREALAQGWVRALVWDHAAVGPQVVCRAGRSRWLTFTLGPGGVYRFRALEQLYQADARAVGDALVVALGGAGRPAARSTA